MMTLLVVSKEEKRCLGLAKRLSKEAKPFVTVVGPAKAAVSKINDFYRYMLYLKSADEMKLMAAKEKIEQTLEVLDLKTENVIFDYD